MNLRMRVRQWLGINEIQEDQSLIARRLQVNGIILARIEKHVIPLGPGIGRLVAKIDPHYATFDPFDPKTREESDAISERVLNNISAEAKAREPHNHGQ